MNTKADANHPIDVDQATPSREELLELTPEQLDKVAGGDQGAAIGHEG